MVSPRVEVSWSFLMNSSHSLYPFAVSCSCFAYHVPSLLPNASKRRRVELMRYVLNYTPYFEEEDIGKLEEKSRKKNAKTSAMSTNGQCKSNSNRPNLLKLHSVPSAERSALTFLGFLSFIMLTEN